VRSQALRYHVKAEALHSGRIRLKIKQLVFGIFFCKVGGRSRPKAVLVAWVRPWIKFSSHCCALLGRVGRDSKPGAMLAAALRNVAVLMLVLTGHHDVFSITTAFRTGEASSKCRNAVKLEHFKGPTDASNAGNHHTKVGVAPAAM
jgi:hypothetical protein